MHPYIHAIQTLLWSENLDNLKPTGRLVETVQEQWDRFREQAEALGFDAKNTVRPNTTAPKVTRGTMPRTIGSSLVTATVADFGMAIGPNPSRQNSPHCVSKPDRPLEVYDDAEGFACLLY